jgi:hypothetical protein
MAALGISPNALREALLRVSHRSGKKNLPEQQEVKQYRWC